MDPVQNEIHFIQDSYAEVFLFLQIMVAAHDIDQLTCQQSGLKINKQRLELPNPINMHNPISHGRKYRVLVPTLKPFETEANYT